MNEKLEKAKEIRGAIQKRNLEAVAKLIGEDRDILTMMTPFGTWLHVAASAGALEVARLLVELGIDVNARGGTFNSNALNNAASSGDIEMVKYLLSCGADLDVSEPERNPLFGAIYGGHIDVAKYLIDSGIDIHVRYTGGSMTNMDALAFAIERGEKQIAALLEQKQQ